MSAFVRRELAYAVACLAAVLSSRALAQADSAAATAPGAAASAEAIDEVTVRGRKTAAQYRLEIEQAREEIFRIYNEANAGKGNDITCRAEQPTGSRMRQDVCRSNAENAGDAAAARAFLNSLTQNAGGFRSPGLVEPIGTQVNANIGAGAAQNAGESGERDALAKFEQEWNRLLREDRRLYRAVVKYAELQDEYARARGATPGSIETDLTVVLEDTPVVVSSGPQCEATTLTEYQQRNNVARVTGTVSIAACPAGSTGSFTITARVRDDNGEIRPLEFNETWRRSDAQDHTFNTDYPIGENVELMGVRVRGLKCTCADAAPGALQ
jgi:hypothetical protein